MKKVYIYITSIGIMALVYYCCLYGIKCTILYTEEMSGDDIISFFPSTPLSEIEAQEYTPYKFSIKIDNKSIFWHKVYLGEFTNCVTRPIDNFHQLLIFDKIEEKNQKTSKFYIKEKGLTCIFPPRSCSNFTVYLPKSYLEKLDEGLYFVKSRNINSNTLEFSVKKNANSTILTISQMR